MPATLKVTRHGVGIELRRGTFRVLLDGKELRTIDWEDTIEETIEPGHHTVQIKIGRYSSEPHSFEASDGEVVEFRCHGAMMWPRFVLSLVKTDLAISLRRE